MIGFLRRHWSWFVAIWGVGCLALLALAVFVDSRIMLALLGLFVVMILVQKPSPCPHCGQPMRARYLLPQHKFGASGKSDTPRCAFCGAEGRGDRERR